MNGQCFFRSGLLVILWIALFAATPSTAGILKIQTRTTVQTTDNQLNITVALANEGTAAAYNLQVHLNVFGTVLDSALKPQLDPGGSNIFNFEKSAGGIKKGRYPLTVSVDFHDANQYPFSALSGTTFSVGPNVNPDLAVLGKNVAMGKKGEFSLDIKNIGVNPKKILATLTLPKELSTPTPQISFHMDPRSEKKLDFEIRNFSALPGADYPVFCYFEYDLAFVHHTAVCMAVIKIIEPENLFRRYRWLWMALAAVLIIAIFILTIKNRGKNHGVSRDK